jgi:hypothetical protein
MKYKFKVGDKLRALPSALNHSGGRRDIRVGELVTVKGLETPWNPLQASDPHEGKPAYSFVGKTQWFHEEHFEFAETSDSQKALIETLTLALFEVRGKHLNLTENHEIRKKNFEKKVENLIAEVGKRDRSLQSAKAQIEALGGSYEFGKEADMNLPLLVPSYAELIARNSRQEKIIAELTPGRQTFQDKAPMKRPSKSARLAAMPVLAKEAETPAKLARERRKLGSSIVAGATALGKTGFRWVMPVVAIAVVAAAVVKVMG